MKNVKGKWSDAEMIEWIGENVHNKLSAKEAISEVVGAGFTDSEVVFLFTIMAEADTFRFKVEAGKVFAQSFAGLNKNFSNRELKEIFNIVNNMSYAK